METGRDRLKAALRFARHQVAQHTDQAWLSHPEGSQRGSVLYDETVTLPVADVNLMIKAATKTLAHTS